MVKCIIVDDEPLALRVLQKHIERTSDLLLSGTCVNAAEAFTLISTGEIELMFLDIKMPGLSGIDLVKSLKNPPQVIFTTAFSEYAIESYELDAVDYLMKPITYERFSKSIQKYFRLNAETSAQPAYTYFKVDGRLVRIEHETLIYAQSIKDYIIIFTNSGSYITHMTMKYLAGLLPSSDFQRVHRSYLVGLKHISGLDSQKIYLGEVGIPIGENFKMEVFALRNKLFKN